MEALFCVPNVSVKWQIMLQRASVKGSVENDRCSIASGLS
uniref:Uncharacterized protein n=1 Tax=Anguilla anguilla TaxID=7936 RepID=A0A0E9W333_ANGAN